MSPAQAYYSHKEKKEAGERYRPIGRLLKRESVVDTLFSIHSEGARVYDPKTLNNIKLVSEQEGTGWNNNRSPQRGGIYLSRAIYRKGVFYNRYKVQRFLICFWCF